MILKIIFLALAAAGWVQAATTNGNYKGNGGYVISCEDGKLQTLDLFEAGDRELKIVQFSEELSEVDIALEVVNRLKKVSPVRAQLYANQIRMFNYKSKLVKTSEFSDVADLGHAYKPDACAFVPTIIQKRNFMDTGIAFFINESIWQKLSKVDKAALIVHEIVYLEFQHEVSALTRSFVGMLFSVDLEWYLTPKRFLGLLETHGANYFEQKGVSIDLQKRYEVDENFVVVKGFVKAGVYSYQNANLHYGPEEIKFHPTGFPASLRLQSGQENTYQVQCVGQLILKNKSFGQILLHEDGLLHQANFDLEKFRPQEKACPSVQFKADADDQERIGAIELDRQQALVFTSGLKAFYHFPNLKFNIRKEISYRGFDKPTYGWFDETTYFTKPDGSVVEAAGGQNNDITLYSAF